MLDGQDRYSFESWASMKLLQLTSWTKMFIYFGIILFSCKKHKAEFHKIHKNKEKNLKKNKNSRCISSSTVLKLYIVVHGIYFETCSERLPNQLTSSVRLLFSHEGWVWREPSKGKPVDKLTEKQCFCGKIQYAQAYFKRLSMSSKADNLRSMFTVGEKPRAELTQVVSQTIWFLDLFFFLTNTMIKPPTRNTISDSAWNTFEFIDENHDYHTKLLLDYNDDPSP